MEDGEEMNNGKVNGPKKKKRIVFGTFRVL